MLFIITGIRPCDCHQPGYCSPCFSFFRSQAVAGPYVFQGKTIETVPELTADAALMPDGFTLPVLIVNGRQAAAGGRSGPARL